jgi:hypothetical protein
VLVSSPVVEASFPVGFVAVVIGPEVAVSLSSSARGSSEHPARTAAMDINDMEKPKRVRSIDPGV